MFNCSPKIYSPLSNNPEAQALNNILKETCESLYKYSYNGGFQGVIDLVNGNRYGENFNGVIPESQIWNQPPGTPFVGLAMVDAFKVTHDSFYLEKALQTAEVLIKAQLPSGGWSHHYDLESDNKEVSSTFDDNISQSCLKFLLSVQSEIKTNKNINDSVDRALSFFINSQKAEGGWPQVYPPVGSFRDDYTFNDRTINDIIETLLYAYQVTNNEKYLELAEEGGSFIIKSQLQKPFAGWAQQYDENLVPSVGRKHEMPAICSRVTRNNMMTLMNLYDHTNNRKYLRPIPDAIAWLEKAKLPSGKWAFFYDLNSTTPVFFNFKSEKFYNRSEVKDKVKNYGPEALYGIPDAIRRYNFIDNEKKVRDTRYYSIKVKNNKKMLEDYLSSRNDNGLWIRDDKLYIGDNTRNIMFITRYISYLVQSQTNLLED